MNLDWGTWLKGLVSAAVGGGVNSVTAMTVSPETFNTGAGAKNVAVMAGVSAAVSAILYLKQSPLPAKKWNGKERRG
jgi:hypothetical protein